MMDFNRLKKNLKKDFTGFKTIKLAILADSASQLLHQAIKGYGYEKQVDFDIYEAEYNQTELEINNAGSELYERKPEFIFINNSTEHLLHRFYKLSPSQQTTFAEQILADLNFYCETISSRLSSKIILNTYPEVDDSVFGNYAAKTPGSFLYQLRKINLQLMELSQQRADLFICDLASLQNVYGSQFTFDPKMYINADLVYSLNYLPLVAKNLTDIILSITGSFKKCLVLDLDNTTWGGIIGDDGMEGIQIGYFGLGKAFTELQLWVKQLKNRGIILAVCSKNTEHIAKEPFESHPDMTLKLEDIAMFVANWETKVDNIRYIQSVLNIGFDSMVFLDDNPFEREMVKSAIPELTVPELPEDPAEYVPYLRTLNLFETASFTKDDADRTKQYQEEASRNIFQRSFANEEEFLASLEMVSEAIPFNAYSIPRVAQLTQRSNQFNLRTVRYTEHEVKAITESPEHYTISLTLEDKFGNHGLIGLIILKKESTDVLFIDTWIMSCRVLKRGVERFTLNQIVQLAKNNNISSIRGEYIPTKKNGIVKDHYKDLGFEQQDGYWVLNVSTYNEQTTFIKNK